MPSEVAKNARKCETAHATFSKSRALCFDLRLKDVYNVLQRTATEPELLGAVERLSYVKQDDQLFQRSDFAFR